MRRGNGAITLDKWSRVKFLLDHDSTLTAVVTNPYEYALGVKSGIPKNRLAINTGIFGVGKVYLITTSKLSELVNI